MIKKILLDIFSAWHLFWWITLQEFRPLIEGRSYSKETPWKLRQAAPARVAWIFLGVFGLGVACTLGRIFWAKVEASHYKATKAQEATKVVRISIFICSKAYIISINQKKHFKHRCFGDFGVIKIKEDKLPADRRPSQDEVYVCVGQGGVMFRNSPNPPLL